MVAAWIGLAAVVWLQGPLTAREAAVLVRCGVEDDEILAAAAALGGVAPADDEDTEALKAAGASDALVDRLLVAEPTLRRLRRLAAWFEPVRGKAGKLSYLRPKSWRAEETEAGAADRAIRVTAPDGRPGDARRELFAFVQQEAGVGPRAEGPFADAAARLLADRLEDLGLKPRPIGTSTVELAGRKTMLYRVLGRSEDSEFEAGVAVTIDSAGTMVGAGYVAPAAGRDEVRALFADFAAALTW
jgi:hypothetical protein